MFRATFTLLLAAPLLEGQTPAFEVATIKPAAPNAGGRMMVGAGRGAIRTDAGMLSARNVSLQGLIRQAYAVQDFQISGGPSWMNADTYDVEAKAATASTPAQLNSMLQALLADRFNLTLHRENKELPVYLLVVDKKGVKFHEAQPAEGSPPRPAPNRIPFKDIGSLVTFLSQMTARPVVDRTGLSGNYDFQLDMSRVLDHMDPAETGGAPSGAPPDRPISLSAVGAAMPMALQDQLGLRLDAARAPVGILIVDRAEKPRTDN